MNQNNQKLQQPRSDNKIQINRPEPIVSYSNLIHYKKRNDPQAAINEILAGNIILIVDYFSSGLTLMNELKNYLTKVHSDQSFQSQHEFRSEFRRLSHKILLKVVKHKLVVRKAPEIGWLDILYPELNEFLLPFPQIQGLNSSWQWYQKGIYIPILNRKIHPWFGTYFPTRFEHLELFDNWLRKYQGPKELAMDIGIGSGVLSFQLLKHGFKNVIGTDSNPNAIIGLQEAINNNKAYSNLNVLFGDLFAKYDVKTELIVFNPPWIPASHQIDGIDNAIYYKPDLFPRFFSEAEKHLKAEGKLVLLFSNLAQMTNTSASNPIEDELQKNNRFTKELFLQQKVGLASKKTKRNQNWRASEFVELWVLKKNK